jgi:hypothetical protein
MSGSEAARDFRTVSRAYGFGIEAKSVRAEIGNFDWYSSRAYSAVRRQFGETLRLKELKALIHAAVFYIKQKRGVDLPHMSRNTKRSFPLLVKYIQTNYDIIIPVLPKMVLCDAQKQPIPLLDAAVLPTE